MVDVKHKRCLSQGCNSHPVFDLPGGKGQFCKTHSTAEMIDVKNKRCASQECDSHPVFDLPGGKGRFCKKHKTAEMIDVKSKRCASQGCNSRPTFDLPGGTGRFCKKHKTEEMVNIKNKRCTSQGCNLYPVFDLLGGTGCFCKAHSTIEMIDVKSKRCATQGCNSQPAFDLPGGKGSFCKTHKTSDMIDVKHKRCVSQDCHTRAYYGRPGHLVTHCHPHRLPGMIRRPNGKCTGCKQPALYGTHFIPRHCEVHREEEDQNLVEQECVSCHLVMVLGEDQRCEYCHPETFQTARLAKQNALMAYLDHRDLKGTSTDTIVNQGDCGKERPDRVYELPDRVIILECDEHQHRDRACVCEQTRMVNISQGYGGTPVSFIRWNPDDYSHAQEKKLPESITKRYKLVGDLIRDMIQGRTLLPATLLSAIYLYYDEWDGLANEPWKILS
jgi:hypothetical protein